MTNLLTSPVGEIWFMAVNEAVANKKTGKARREICLLLDTEKSKEFITAVKKVNKGIPVTEHTYSGEDDRLKEALKGKTKISAGTQFKVKIYDAKKLEALSETESASLAEIEESPNFFIGDKGTAQMVVEPYTKSEKGGSINLVAVILHDIETSGEGGDRETRLVQLRAMVKQDAKG